MKNAIGLLIALVSLSLSRPMQGKAIAPNSGSETEDLCHGYPCVDIGRELSRNAIERASAELNKCLAQHAIIPLPEVMKNQRNPEDVCARQLEQYERRIAEYVQYYGTDKKK